MLSLPFNGKFVNECSPQCPSLYLVCLEVGFILIILDRWMLLKSLNSDFKFLQALRGKMDQFILE